MIIKLYPISWLVIVTLTAICFAMEVQNHEAPEGGVGRAID